jgi:hypothetical protein
VKQYGFSVMLTLLAGLVAAGKYIMRGLGAAPGVVVILLLAFAILGLGPTLAGRER